MDLDKLSASELAELEARIEAKKRAEKQKREDDINAYKDSVDEFVRKMYGILQPLSDKLAEAKNLVFSEANAIIDMKESLYDTKVDRHSNTFTTSDGKLTLSLGYRTVDGWDDTVESGISKIKEYMKTLAKDEAGAKMYELLMELLKRDKKGNLKANALLTLEQHAQRFGDPLFLEGVAIIKAAYRPTETSQFISLIYKDEHGVKHSVPLSLSRMDIE
ncbi:MAG: DUF3164 family protein [Bacteroidales bacterium]|nr:DUF3164 family protein [Bacteroidales bacterium]